MLMAFRGYSNALKGHPIVGVTFADIHRPLAELISPPFEFVILVPETVLLHRREQHIVLAIRGAEDGHVGTNASKYIVRHLAQHRLQQMLNSAMKCLPRIAYYKQ